MVDAEKLAHINKTERVANKVFIIFSSSAGVFFCYLWVRQNRKEKVPNIFIVLQLYLLISRRKFAVFRN
jgi:hypothetical protein